MYRLLTICRRRHTLSHSLPNTTLYHYYSDILINGHITQHTHAHMPPVLTRVCTQNATVVVRRREAAYRSPLTRVAGWLPHDTRKDALVTTYQVRGY